MKRMPPFNRPPNVRPHDGPIFIDMMSVRGHVNLNRFYLSQFTDLNPVLYISSDLRCAFSESSTRSLGPNPCSARWGCRVKTALRVLRVLFQERPDQVFFLSYDLATFPLITHVAALLGAKIVCLEHNTAPRSIAKRLSHILMAKFVTRLVYAPHIQKIYNQAGIETIYVPHPCVHPATKTEVSKETRPIIDYRGRGFERMAFCPSGTVTLEAVEAIAEHDRTTLFVCKNANHSRLANVICRDYFEDYDGMIDQSDFICLPFELEYKVSGPAFEAIAMGKPILLLPNAFGKYMKSVFGDSISISDSRFPFATEFTHVSEFNDSIIEAISKCLEGNFTDSPLFNSSTRYSSSTK